MNRQERLTCQLKLAFEPRVSSMIGHTMTQMQSLAGNRSVVLYMQGNPDDNAPTWEFKDGPAGSSNQILYVYNMPVFRSGTFKDSLGEQLTYEPIHIDEMASYFSLLRNNQVFTDVPVRKGHGSFFGDPMTGLVGYHDAVRTKDIVAKDGNTYRYFLVDFHLPNPEDQQNFITGLWRNRSSEVGWWESNEGATYYPVYQGFAFVDIPAVQYLNVFSNAQRQFSLLDDEKKELIMSGTPAPPPVATPAPESQGEGAYNFSCGGMSTNNFAAVQKYITDLENRCGELTTDNDRLTEFYSATQLQTRRDFVSKLASDKKILASQLESLTKYAVELPSQEAFTKWSELYINVPEIPLFGRFGGNGNGSAPPADPANPDESSEEKDFRLAYDTVKWNKDGGMRSEVIKNTASFKRMTELATKLGKEPVKV